MFILVFIDARLHTGRLCSGKANCPRALTVPREEERRIHTTNHKPAGRCGVCPSAVRLSVCPAHHNPLVTPAVHTSWRFFGACTLTLPRSPRLPRNDPGPTILFTDNNDIQLLTSELLPSSSSRSAATYDPRPATNPSLVPRPKFRPETELTRNGEQDVQHHRYLALYIVHRGLANKSRSYRQR